MTRYDGEPDTRPDLVSFRCNCGYRGKLHIAPTKAHTSTITMRQAHRLGLSLRIACPACKRYVFTQLHQWQQWNRPTDTPITALKFRCTECGHTRPNLSLTSNYLRLSAHLNTPTRSQK